MTPVPDPGLATAFRALITEAVESVAAQEVENVPGCWGPHARYRRTDGSALDAAELAALERAHIDGLITNGRPAAGRYRPLQPTPDGWELIATSWFHTGRTRLLTP